MTAVVERGTAAAAARDARPPRRRQDRHDERQHRCVVHRLHRPRARRGVDRLRRSDAQARHRGRWRARRAAAVDARDPGRRRRPPARSRCPGAPPAGHGAGARSIARPGCSRAATPAASSCGFARAPRRPRSRGNLARRQRTSAHAREFCDESRPERVRVGVLCCVGVWHRRQRDPRDLDRRAPVPGARQASGGSQADQQGHPRPQEAVARAPADDRERRARSAARSATSRARCAATRSPARPIKKKASSSLTEASSENKILGEAGRSRQAELAPAEAKPDAADAQKPPTSPPRRPDQAAAAHEPQPSPTKPARHAAADAPASPIPRASTRQARTTPTSSPR